VRPDINDPHGSQRRARVDTVAATVHSAPTTDVPAAWDDPDHTGRGFPSPVFGAALQGSPLASRGRGDARGEAGRSGALPADPLRWLRRSTFPENGTATTPGVAPLGLRPPVAALRRSTGDAPIRRFFAVVDDPIPGKHYPKVGGREYEWIDGERDPEVYELSAIRTGWWFRNLYQRKIISSDPSVDEAKSRQQPSFDEPGQPTDISGSTTQSEQPKQPGQTKKTRRRKKTGKVPLGSDDRKTVTKLAQQLQPGEKSIEQPSAQQTSRPRSTGGIDVELQGKSPISVAEDLLNGATDDADRKITQLDTIAIATRSGTPTTTESTDEKWSLSEEQLGQAAIDWGLTRDDPKFVFATSNELNYKYFRSLDAEQRTYLSKTKMRKRQVPTAEDIEQFKESLALAAQREREALDAAERERSAKEAKEVAEKKRSEGEAKWKEFQQEIRETVQHRVQQQFPDFLWEAKFNEIIDATSERIGKNKTINIDRQIQHARRDVAAFLDQEQKRRDLAEAIKKYPNVFYAKLTTIRDEVLNAPTLPAAEFDVRATAARTAQRNSATAADWAKMLQIRLYGQSVATPFDNLTPRDGLEVHVTVSLDGFSVPVVTDTTTPDELLDALFAPADQYKRIHVSLETGVEAGPDNLKLPHRYWNYNGGRALYALRFDGNVRWNPETHDEGRIKLALDQAYAELRTKLRDRAQILLDNDCHPRYR
jgi:hypothetical protein